MRAQVADERAGVDAGDADDRVLAHVVAEALLRAPAARGIPILLDDEAADERAPRLRVLAVDADVADLGIRHRHELAGVRGIGEDLLVAGHRGIEDDLAAGLAVGAERGAAKDGAVGEREYRGFDRGLTHWSRSVRSRSATRYSR